ncbi:efflux transporter periplasmic adaptor subunit, partial [bacterium]|nr:efflux transporter periplasmic adaptor subunit [bacterium]
QKADGSIETRTIETGVTSNNLTQVISGLSEGEQVVFDLPEFSSNQNSNRGSMGGMGGMGGAPPAGGGSGGSGPRP